MGAPLETSARLFDIYAQFSIEIWCRKIMSDDILWCSFYYVPFPFHWSIHTESYFNWGHKCTRLMASSKPLCKSNGGERHGTCLRWNLQSDKHFCNWHGAHRALRTYGSLTHSPSPKRHALVHASLHKNSKEIECWSSWSIMLQIHYLHIYTAKASWDGFKSVYSRINLHTILEGFFTLMWNLWIQILP